MRAMQKWIAALTVAGLLLGVAGCSSDPTGSEEYQAVEAELAAAQAERDVLASELAEIEAAAASRREKSMATMAEITGIIDNPVSVGSQEEVLDELMSHVAPGAVMEDAVFGAVPMRTAWRNTLFGGRDARIETWHRWMSADGSQGGALWTWSGTNFAGEPFELIGVVISEYDEEGKETHEYVTYPYEHEVVRATLNGTAPAASASDPVEPFDFESDDLCEWVSAEQVAALVEEAFGWEATAVALEPDQNCEWLLNGDGGQGHVQISEAVWQTFGGAPYDMPAAFDRVEDFSDVGETTVPIGAAVSGHRSLSEGVVVHNGGFGQFAFGVPPAEQYLQVWVDVPGEDEWETFEPKLFEVANGFVDVLGWLPEG